MEALALYEQSEVGLDLWPNAVAKLEKLIGETNASSSLIYNLARLLESRPRPVEARGYWNRLAEIAHRLPVSIRTIVCRKQSAVKPGACGRADSLSAKKPPWQWPLNVTGFQQLSVADSAKRLTNWKVVGFDWVKAKLHGHFYQSPDGRAEVLELDRFVQMQVLKGQSLGTTAKLAQYCSQALRQRTVSQGRIWTCDHWAALTSDDTVEQLWWVAK